jgi:hypothetical protein
MIMAGHFCALGRLARPQEDMVMRLSSSVVAPFGVAVLSIVLLCGPAASQTATGSAATLPPVTVEAPKQAARPKHVVHTAVSRRTSSTGHTRSATAQPSTVNRSNAIGSARFSIREDWQAGESRQQLQRWL